MKRIVQVYKAPHQWINSPPGLGDFIRGACHLHEFLSSKNIDSFKTSDNPIILRLLNLGTNTNIPLNLSNDWSYNIIKQIGNYEEIFERNLGSQSLIKLDRGINKLWNKGGIMYSPPLK
jgi:general L-amino acid transport system substrate-binding protein